MTTSYTLSIGYISGGEYNQQEAWELLKEKIGYAQSVHHFWTPIIKALYQWNHGWLTLETLQEYCDIYRAAEFCPLRVIEEGDERYIFISASGGGESRRIKELVALAFCRRIIEKMNLYYEIPVNLTVA